MNQREKILRHLQSGKTITPLEAMGVYGVWRLGARIFELRELGYDIATYDNRDPQGKPYAEYELLLEKVIVNA